MFLHNYKYSLKVLLKNKTLIFWTLLFPIVLGTFFNMAFGNINSEETLDIFKVGVIDSVEYKNNTVLNQVFNDLSNNKSDNYLFDIVLNDEEELIKDIENNKIIGYIKVEEDIKVFIKENGIYQTIFKNVVDQIIEYQSLYENVFEYEQSKYQDIYELKLIGDKLEKLINNTKSNINDTSSNNMNVFMIEFYTLVAMACLYGAILSIYVVNNFLANMSKKGARISISPIKKSVMLLSGLLASFTVQLFGILVLIIYTKYILNIDYGSNVLNVCILSFIGSLTGLILGLFISSIIKKDDEFKISVCISYTMICSFFSGMMGITMKYLVDKKFPIINYINPANMITDGFYSLYYYNTPERFYFNIISLIVYSIVLLVISFVVLRREKYDSI